MNIRLRDVVWSLALTVSPLAACGDDGETTTDTAATTLDTTDTPDTTDTTVAETTEADTVAETTAEETSVATTSETVADTVGDTGATETTTEVVQEPAIVAGEPITATAGTWTWVDFPDALCDDGTATGVGVNLAADSDDVLVFVMGGGACWDYLTCYTLNTATHGPMQATQFNNGKNMIGGILDRNDPKNPFKDYNFVFVPYCTGDLHSGNAVQTYSKDGDTKTYHHVGHANMRAFLARLKATFPTTAHLVVSGASAGGYGAFFNYGTIRDALTPTSSLLIDDSGPPLIGEAVPSWERDQWLASWGNGVLLAQVCGPNCKDDFSLGIPAIAERYPNDRLSLLSSLQDKTISSYIFADGPTFETEIRDLATSVIAPISTMRVFYVTGNSHTMLGNPNDFDGLWEWLGAQATGTNWGSVIPPVAP